MVCGVPGAITAVRRGLLVTTRYPLAPQEVGYQHGKTVFDVWCRSGVVEKMLKDRHQEDFRNTKSNDVSADGQEWVRTSALLPWRHRGHMPGAVSPALPAVSEYYGVSLSAS